MRRPVSLIALLLALLVVLLVGAWLAGRTQPLVRNSLVYARAAWNVIDADYDPRPIVADSRRSYDKPIGFAWLAAPLVRRFGAHDGLRLASLAGTLAIVLASGWFAARNLRRDGSDPSTGDELAAVAWLSGFGPLVAYQGWSAHPDGWFAALFVVAIVLTQQLAYGRAASVPWRAALLAVTIVAAFLLKNYALILVPCCALHLLLAVPAMRRAATTGERRLGWRLAWSGAALLLAGGFVLAARFDHNPLSRLEGEGGGADQYAFAEVGSIGWKTLTQAGLALAVQFHLLLPAAAVAWLLARRRGATRDGGRIGVSPWWTFGVPCVVGLLPFPTAFYNMRYFLPLFPLAATSIVIALRGARPSVRRALLVAFFVVNAATLLLWNVPAVFDRMRPLLPDTKVTWLAGGPPLALLDNLRMEQHRDQAAWLDAIRRELEPGATLYLLDVGYYRDAQHGVFERDGFLRADLAIRYASRRNFRPAEPRFHVWSLPEPDLTLLQSLGTVTPIGPKLFRIER